MGLTTRKWRNRKTIESKKTVMLRSIGKQSGESRNQSKTKKEGYSGKDLQKREVLSQE